MRKQKKLTGWDILISEAASLVNEADGIRPKLNEEFEEEMGDESVESDLGDDMGVEDVGEEAPVEDVDADLAGEEEVAEEGGEFSEATVTDQIAAWASEFGVDEETIHAAMLHAIANAEEVEGEQEEDLGVEDEIEATDEFEEPGLEGEEELGGPVEEEEEELAIESIRRRMRARIQERKEAAAKQAKGKLARKPVKK